MDGGSLSYRSMLHAWERGLATFGPMRILITAGPTREPLDAVRVLTNRSSGQLGIAVASEAMNRGHDTTLLLGHGADMPPQSLEGYCQRFDSTNDLCELLQDAFPRTDLLIMAAAVADFIPEQAPPGTKRSRHDGPINVTLHPAPDLVASLAKTKRPDQAIVGFALEPAATLRERATAKLSKKGLDAIVANPLDTMESTHITATLIWADGHTDTAPPDLPKKAFASWLLDRVATGP
jgi:phosphopantothenoylcysteine decarboxylase/phosphopantothenate--cysteine ligase